LDEVDGVHRLAFDPAADAAKRAEQARLQETYEMQFLGMGPAATGSQVGWSMAAGLYFRCTRCGYFMAADPTAYDECLCGYLHKDAGAGRFGSHLGDEAIEVYRATAIPPGS
jgi:hypothetical protein